MGGIAQLARAAGHRVTGSDANVYPPMSEQLRDAGIDCLEGYDPGHLEPEPDCVVIGNALGRGNPAVEHLLARGIRYTSGAQWLAAAVGFGLFFSAVTNTCAMGMLLSKLPYNQSDRCDIEGVVAGMNQADANVDLIDRSTTAAG